MGLDVAAMQARINTTAADFATWRGGIKQPARTGIAYARR